MHAHIDVRMQVGISACTHAGRHVRMRVVFYACWKKFTHACSRIRMLVDIFACWMLCTHSGTQVCILLGRMLVGMYAFW
jgi:hypothetical protein